MLHDRPSGDTGHQISLLGRVKGILVFHNFIRNQSIGVACALHDLFFFRI